MISLHISNDIQVKGLPPKHLAHIQKSLSLRNPLYDRLVGMRNTRALYACPRFFKYYKMNGETLRIPRGFRLRLLRWLEACELEYETKEDFIMKRARYPKSTVELRPHQAEALGAMEDKNEGVVVLGTGTGKTILGIEKILELGLTATILVPNTALLAQWRGELRKFYGIEAGVIYAKEKEIKDITIATFQSLYKPTKLVMDLVANTSVLYVDEVHGAVTKEKSKVLGRFKPSYLFGTTATMKREDKQDDAIGFYMGPTLFEHHATQASPSVHVVNTRTRISVDEYPRMIEEMVENESRNTLIKGRIIGERLEGRKILVLTKRVAHAESLYAAFAGHEGSHLIHSSDKDRNALLGRLRSGEQEFGAIFGTTSLLSVGVDIPTLDTLVLACDMKAETLLIQSVGRVLRLFKDKPDPRIIDFYEGRDFNPILYSQFRKRLAIYKSKGWPVEW